ncbi:MAG: hypothetical protein M3156_01025 [Thermoproteota archaeon]|nr:hypothetical protein [Thermoproteota archaeon]
MGILIISNYNRGYGVEEINTIRGREELSNRKIEILYKSRTGFLMRVDAYRLPLLYGIEN